VIRRLATALVVLGCVAGAAGWWYYRSGRLLPVIPPEAAVKNIDWLEHIHSPNPSVAEEAALHLKREGGAAVPDIQAALRDPGATADRKKGALKACAVLGTVAAPALNDVAAHLAVPALTVEAAIALSFMGQAAFEPLRNALASEDPAVRRESLRAIGKLRERAPLESAVVIPLLLDGLADPEPGVRIVSATYLGIIHEDSAQVVPALMETLEDEEADVRTASAGALGAFGPEAGAAVPALRKAVGDPDENVAREAGVALVKLSKQP
jgi:HEAT repeat protein